MAFARVARPGDSRPARPRGPHWCSNFFSLVRCVVVIPNARPDASIQTTGNMQVIGVYDWAWCLSHREVGFFRIQDYLGSVRVERELSRPTERLSCSCAA